MELSDTLKARLQQQLTWVNEELAGAKASKERCEQMLEDREAEIVKLNKDKVELEQLLA